MNLINRFSPSLSDSDWSDQSSQKCGTFSGLLPPSWRPAALFAGQDLENMTTSGNQAGTYVLSSWKRVEVHSTFRKASQWKKNWETVK